MSIKLLENCLESEFEQQAFCDVDILAHREYIDFLNPNECTPHKVREHLTTATKGIIVSVGTERSFFDLLLANDSCEGLVVRDINPRVKAYVDFVVLLLRICDTTKEFNRLTTYIDVNNEKALKGRVKEITDVMDKGSLPERVQAYYLKNLENFAKIYLNERRDPPHMYKISNWRGNWAEQGFSAVRYDLHEEQFLKLQKFARSGNIISTIGDINQLSFLRKRKVSVVDTSNICTGTMIDLQGEGDFHPRVIWTGADFRSYDSIDWITLTPSARAEYENLVNSIKRSKQYNDFTPAPGYKDALHSFLIDSGFYYHDTIVTPGIIERLRQLISSFDEFQKRQEVLISSNTTLDPEGESTRQNKETT